MFVQVSALPRSVQSFLNSLGFNKSDIKVEGRESVSPSDPGRQGSQAYFGVINLDTGEETEINDLNQRIDDLMLVVDELLDLLATDDVMPIDVQKIIKGIHKKL